MARIFKIILSIFAAVLLLIIIAAVAVPMFVDPNDFKPQIQAVVKDNTGRDLNIEGDIKLSFFPWIGVSTGKLTLSNAEGFSDNAFAEILQSNIKVKLIPLLSKKVEISRIVLKGLSLNLEKDKQGRTNWDDLASDKSTPEPAEIEDKIENDSDAVNPLAALAIGGISIEQANIVWDDQQANQHVEVIDFNFKSDKLVFDKPIPIELSLKVVNKEPQLTVTLQFSSELVISEQLDDFKLNNIKIESITEGKDIPGKTLKVNLLSDIALNITQQTLAVSDLKIKSGNLSIIADINGSKITDNPVFNGSINVTTPDLTRFLESLEISLPKNKNAKALKNLSVAFNLKSTANSADIQNLVIKLDDTTIDGSARISNITDNPIVDSSINMVIPNLAQFLESLAISLPDKQDAEVLKKLTVAFKLKSTANSADIQNLVVKLDDTTIDGSASINNFSKPAIKFNLKVDEINLDRYLPKKLEKTNKAASTPAATAVASAALFPVETLRALNVNGQLSINKLLVNNMKINGVNLKLKAKNGKIQTHQTIKRLYKGSYSGSTAINVQNKTPTLRLNEKLSNVQIEPLLKDMKLDILMQGTTNASAKIQARGNSISAIKSSMNGNLEFSFKDSVIKGFNLQKIIDSAKGLLDGGTLPTKNKNDQTVFSIISGTAQIKNGVLSNNDLLAESSKVRVKGKGTVNISNEALKFNVNSRVIKRTATDTKAEKIRGIPVIINVGGTLSKPTYQLDIIAMAAEKYKHKIEKEKQKLIKKLDDKVFKKLDEKLGPGVGDLIKGFF